MLNHRCVAEQQNSTVVLYASENVIVYHLNIVDELRLHIMHLRLLYFM